MPEPPATLRSGDVVLHFDHLVPGDPHGDFVPYYHFRIWTNDGTDVGHVNFRVGDAEHVRRYIGHIGYGIAEEHRGHGYARQACLALAPFIRCLYKTVLITCDSDNRASQRTIERLGAAFIDEVAKPTPDGNVEGSAGTKLRYHWAP
jgi:predicted acetyltransferase